ncbi:hypothetical protein KUTeg_021728 [Tegillarca granosa]|uniref:Uncharacterized protein n=1 Tax=Tegillarca granosa TaxID=220873 RepID=A0ABQ9E7A9_TEGGR|nr:hypothetical protein KUTeg_021728 [Tegillarca granosa]
MVQTKFGRYSTGSPIGIQQKLSTHFVLNILDAEDFSPLPVKNVKENEYSVVLDRQKCARFSSISITTEECHSIENLTRLQSLDPKWHAIRKDRITASVAGDIVKRKADSEPLVSRLKSNRRLQDQNINIYPCGIEVSPYAPWLAASPDRKVYSTTIVPPHGLLKLRMRHNYAAS